jgi:LysM repeat protein
MYDEQELPLTCHFHTGTYGNHGCNSLTRTWSCCGAHEDKAKGCMVNSEHVRCEATHAALEQFGSSSSSGATTGLRRRGPAGGGTTVVEDIKAAPKGIPENAVIYTVGVADTLASIALRHSMNVGQLKKWNKLLSPNVYAGQQIYVMPPPPPTPEQKRAEDIRKLMKRGGLQTQQEAAYYVDGAGGNFEGAWEALCADNAAIAPAEVVEAEDEGWLHVMGTEVAKK